MSLVGQWLRFCLSRQGARGPSLVVGAKIPQCLGAKKPKHKKKQYRNKVNKDFKNGPHTHTKKNFKKYKGYKLFDTSFLGSTQEPRTFAKMSGPAVLQGLPVSPKYNLKFFLRSAGSFRTQQCPAASPAFLSPLSFPQDPKGLRFSLIQATNLGP